MGMNKFASTLSIEVILLIFVGLSTLLKEQSLLISIDLWSAMKLTQSCCWTYTIQVTLNI